MDPFSGSLCLRWRPAAGLAHPGRASRRGWRRTYTLGHVTVQSPARENARDNGNFPPCTSRRFPGARSRKLSLLSSEVLGRARRFAAWFSVVALIAHRSPSDPGCGRTTSRFRPAHHIRGSGRLGPTLLSQGLALVLGLGVQLSCVSRDTAATSATRHPRRRTTRRHAGRRARGRERFSRHARDATAGAPGVERRDRGGSRRTAMSAIVTFSAA